MMANRYACIAALLILIAALPACFPADDDEILPEEEILDFFADPEINLENACGYCAAPVATDETVAFIFFKKFIANLFNRKSLTYHEDSKKYYRSITFALQPEQLEKLEQLSDPRDLDYILTQIFAKAQSNTAGTSSQNTETSITMMILHTLSTIPMDVFYSYPYEISFIIACAAVIGSIWFASTKYNIAKWKLIVGGSLLFGYSITYLECNRKLAMEDIIETLQLSNDENFFTRSWSSLSRMVGMGSNENARLAQELRNSAKVKLKFCRPDHVAWKYLNEMFIMQLQFIFEALTESFQSITGKFGFPYNYIVPPLFVFTFLYVLKLIFKYFLNPKSWAPFVYARSLGPQQKTTIDCGDHEKDRITGQNLTKLLDVLHKVSNQMSTVNLQYSTQQESMLVCSGVQEITEKNNSSDQLLSDDKDNDEILIDEQPLGENTETSSDDIELTEAELIDKKPIDKNETNSNCSERNFSREPKLVIDDT